MHSANVSVPVPDFAAPVLEPLPPHPNVRQWLAECVKLCQLEQGLEVNHDRFAAVQVMDADAMKREILTHEELFLKLAGELPKELIFQRKLLIARL
jgi:hypothetical protein